MHHSTRHLGHMNVSDEGQIWAATVFAIWDLLDKKA